MKKLALLIGFVIGWFFPIILDLLIQVLKSTLGS